MKDDLLSFIISINKNQHWVKINCEAQKLITMVEEYNKTNSSNIKIRARYIDDNKCEIKKMSE
jgi:hypothetical protein